MQMNIVSAARTLRTVVLRRFTSAPKLAFCATPSMRTTTSRAKHHEFGLEAIVDFLRCAAYMLRLEAPARPLKYTFNIGKIFF
ncbi:hypothetical protein F2981_19010 (plasmid) [Sinorhizobium meliloti]|nr:hypothetical protein [Sinorhizobium meliloti]